MPVPASQVTPQLLHLPDGRRLAWYEFGDPRGRPCIYTTGTPASGLMGLVYHEAERNAGVRWISVDKPGYGHSDFQPRRRLLDWPGDIEALAQCLRLERFAVAGESGGGPHALALAYALPRRISVVLLVSAMGPGHEDWVREGMNPLNRHLFWVARHAPWLLRWSLSRMALNLRDPNRRARFMQKRLAILPPAERARVGEPETLNLQMEAALSAFRQGSSAAAQEMRLFTSKWGFRLEDISTPVVLWHGVEDASVPAEVARHMAAALPNCHSHFVEGAGHALSLEFAQAIVAEVV